MLALVSSPINTGPRASDSNFLEPLTFTHISQLPPEHPLARAFVALRAPW
jgi:hypothetical protein